MKIAAGILGIIAGLMSLTYVGLYGGLVGGAASWFGSFGPQGNDVSSWAETVKFLSWCAPLLVLVGGGLCFTKPSVGGLLLGTGAFAHWYLLGFGFIGNLFIIPPAIAAMLAFAAAGGELEQRAVERAGTPLPPSPAAPICSSCGKHNSADARFCAGCGSAFVTPDEPVAAVATATSAQPVAPNAPFFASPPPTFADGFAGLQEWFARLPLAAKLAIGATVIVVVGIGTAILAFHRPSAPSSLPQPAEPATAITEAGPGTGFIGTQLFGSWTLHCDSGGPVIKNDSFGRCRVNLIYRRKDDAKQVVMVIALRLLGPQQHLAVIVVLPRVVKKGDELNLQAGSKSLKIPVSVCKPESNCAALAALGSNGEAALLSAPSAALFFPPDASGKRSRVGVPFTGLSAAVEAMRRAEQPITRPQQ